MKTEVIDPGYFYILHPHMQLSEVRIPFAKDEKDHRHDGITDEQVIDMLIDRYKYLSTPKPRKQPDERAVRILGALYELKTLL